MVTIDSKKEETDEQKESDDNNSSKKKITKKKKTIVIGARIHPGETPSSYVCQGMINFLLGDSPVAEILRDSVTFKFIPMLNPDGVFVGNYRTCILGQDLNRCWQETSIHAYPTLAAVKSVIESLSSVKEEEMDMYLDLHAHTGLLGAFVYGNTYSDVYRFQRHTLFPKHLSYCAEDFSLENTAYNKDKNKSGTSRRFLSAFLNDKVNCYTLEVSFHGYEVQKGNATTVSVYNEEDCILLKMIKLKRRDIDLKALDYGSRENFRVSPYLKGVFLYGVSALDRMLPLFYLRLGESICQSLLDYYCATKYIPAEAIPSDIRETLTKTAKAKVLAAGNIRSPTRIPSANKTATTNSTSNGKNKDNGNKVTKTKANQKSVNQQQLQPKIVDIKEPTLPS